MEHKCSRSLGTVPAGFSVAASFMLLVLMPAIFSVTAYGQPNRLSLADILIGLRSKKVTLPERNKILTEAVVTRGTTFTVTPEIEQELSATGADKHLIDSIRTKGTMVKATAVMEPSAAKADNETAASSDAPDFAFYEKRANDSIAKGEVDAALIDLTRSIEMNGSNVSPVMNRGDLYFGKGLYNLAIGDYTKVIELAPQDAAVYARRAEAHEKRNEVEAAVRDLTKVLEIAPDNASATAALARLKPAPPKVEEVATAAAPPVTIPEYVGLGALDESRAIRMVKPIYPPSALQFNASGQVIVDVELDTEGNVTSAKVKSGHPYLRQSALDAARRSKFKAAMIGTQAVKGKGTITYRYDR